jgi:hypothetical protein
MQHLSAEQDLLPWEEVTERWNQKSGQKLTRGRVCQIARRAHEKLRERLQTVAGLVS